MKNEQSYHRKTAIFPTFFLLIIIILFTAAVNAADPAITPIPVQNATVGTILSFTVNATNPNNGTLMYGLGASAPPGATIDASAGMFTWTPSDEGRYDFNITVDDMVVLQVSSPVSIIVSGEAETAPPELIPDQTNTTDHQDSISGTETYGAPPIIVGVGLSPVITLLGRNPASLSNGSVGYYDAGAMASDPEDGNLTALINVTSNVNVGVAGSYSVVYNVTDSGGNTVNATRIVNVTNRLDPGTIPKFQTPLLIPPEMPKTVQPDPNIDYYEIAVREFRQQILPAGLPNTTVWSYGSATTAGTFNYPAFSIEATYNRTTKVRWINDLVDANGNYLPHLLPIDQTLHWANPPGGLMGRDMHGTDPNPYMGPVPAIIHVHGAHTYQESDGYPEAWYLPAANNIPAGYATTGTYYDTFRANATYGAEWATGTAVFNYPNQQRATTLWYHDHSLGMTRTNVYAGPAGFYLLRNGSDDMNLGFNRPGLTLGIGVNPADVITEIPLAIQDRSFNEDGSLFYPDSRAFFDGFTGPYAPTSDIAPIWNPEFFGDTIVVNGNTWPYLDVQQRQYRLRILNGDQARFLILNMSNGMNFTQIGTEGGFLPQTVSLNQLLIGPAERADVIVDFTAFPVGTNITLQNIGPDSPFGGGVPGVDFPIANTSTTGQVMQFRVTSAAAADPSIPVGSIVLPAMTKLGPENKIRNVSLNEVDSATVIDPISGLPFGPRAALLGTVTTDPVTGMPMGMPMMWMDAVTESITQGDTEIWQIYDFTMDAHPIHIHQVQFEVIDREIFDPMYGTPGTIIPREPWETGYKDTVIVYPGQLTRVKARFDLPGLFVWHCHILEHEDNEMMRPYTVLAAPQPSTGIGLRRPSTTRWYLDYDNNGLSDYKVYWGASTDIPVTGDWDNDGFDEIGLWRPSTGRWYLDYDNNGLSDYKVYWGASTDIPVTGDWDNDGFDEIGLWRPSTTRWYLDYDNNGLSDYKVYWGASTDKPVTGDWDNDGFDEIGLWRPSTTRWYLDYDNNGLSDYKVYWGASTDKPVTGDWDNDGFDEIGLWRPSTTRWYLDYDNNGLSDYKVYWGASTDNPITGKWH